MPGTPFHLLFVCTGNLCRSPFAEILGRHLLLRHLGRDAADFTVSSAGVGAVVGAGMHPDSRAELTPWGLHGAAAEAFTARQLHPEMIERADLVLALTPRHRSAVVQQAPRALSTAFSLREFARLTDLVDRAGLPPVAVDRARALVGRARLARPLAAGHPADHDEIPDPIGLPPPAHHTSAVLISSALRTIVDAVAEGDSSPA